MFASTLVSSQAIIGVEGFSQTMQDFSQKYNLNHLE